MAILSLITVGVSSGFHVFALQGLAFARMFNEYQKLMPVSEAIQFTFSGNELCGICVAVDEIQADMEDDLSSFEQQFSQICLIHPATVEIALAPRVAKAQQWTIAEEHLFGISLPTDTPPPRPAVA